MPHNTDHLITGPQALSYADTAAIIASVTSRPVRHRAVDTATMAEAFVGIGMPPAYAAMLAGLDENTRRGAEDQVTSTVPDLTGRPARSFTDFVTAHRDAFAA